MNSGHTWTGRRSKPTVAAVENPRSGSGQANFRFVEDVCDPVKLFQHFWAIGKGKRSGEKALRCSEKQINETVSGEGVLSLSKDASKVESEDAQWTFPEYSELLTRRFTVPSTQIKGSVAQINVEQSSQRCKRSKDTISSQTIRLITRANRLHPLRKIKRQFFISYQNGFLVCYSTLTSLSSAGPTTGRNFPR